MWPSGLLVAAGVALLCFLSLYRVVVGPHTEDRLAAVSVISTKAMLVMVIWASTTGVYEFLDVALVGVLLGFVAVMAVLKGLYKGHLD